MDHSTTIKAAIKVYISLIISLDPQNSASVSISSNLIHKREKHPLVGRYLRLTDTVWCLVSTI